MSKKLENLFVHVLLIIASLWSLTPVLWILSTSFKNRADIYTTKIQLWPHPFTWDNYAYLWGFNNHIFLRWLQNSIIIALATTLLGVMIAATASYAFARFTFKGKQAGSLAVILTQMFPGVILIIPLYNLFKNLHLLNSYFGLILAYCTTALPFCIWMLKGFFDTVPVELEEAAWLDGLSRFGTFLRIVMPLSVPGIAVTAFYTFITAWNEFMFALTFMSEEILYTLPVGLRTFVFEFRTDWHWMSAGAIILTLPVLLFFFFAQKYLITGLTAGGVKG
jgi:arabinogalactan oligomer / maltooligosaccharide transport system permease protein